MHTLARVHVACELPETRIGGEPMLPPVIFMFVNKFYHVYNI
jgi:hypothetical protein